MARRKKKVAKRKGKGNLLGAWAFLIGLILAIVFGIFREAALTDLTITIITIILFVIGIVVGLMNIANKEVMPFLAVGTVLVIVSAFGAAVMSTIPVVSRMLDALLIIFVPATIIVAMKAAFLMAKK